MFNCVGCLKKQQLKQTTKNVSKFLKKKQKIILNAAVSHKRGSEPFCVYSLCGVFHKY